MTMAGYAQVYGRWQPEPLRVFLEASVPAAALLVVWLGIRCWSGRRGRLAPSGGQVNLGDLE